MRLWIANKLHALASWIAPKEPDPIQAIIDDLQQMECKKLEVAKDVVEVVAAIPDQPIDTTGWPDTTRLCGKVVLDFPVSRDQLIDKVQITEGRNGMPILCPAEFNNGDALVIHRKTQIDNVNEDRTFIYGYQCEEQKSEQEVEVK